MQPEKALPRLRFVLAQFTPSNDAALQARPSPPNLVKRKLLGKRLSLSISQSHQQHSQSAANSKVSAVQKVTIGIGWAIGCMLST